jgi:thiol-disulfide isomerase/thioredoxin
MVPAACGPFVACAYIQGVQATPGCRCGPCRQIIPHLTAIYEARKAKGLSVVGVSIEDDPTLEQFVQADGSRMGYTVAVDTQGQTQSLMQQAHVSGIPHAFVVDHGGKIVYRCALYASTRDCIP